MDALELVPRWPAAGSGRVSPGAGTTAPVMPFSVRDRPAPSAGLSCPRAAFVMLSMPVFLGGAAGHRDCPPRGTGAKPYASRRARSEPSLRSVLDPGPPEDPSNPAGRRKEIDNVMKRARQSSPGSWDLKLLEVEEKDPNRWRHTGYKQMYMDSPPRRSTTPRRSNTPPHRRSRSPVNRRSRSRTPPPRRRSPASRREPAPAPAPSASRRRSPRRTPLSRVSPVRSPRRRSPATRRPPARRPPSPPAPPRKSSSGSSVSSCSDESCSVCSAKNKKTAPPPPPKGAKIPSRKTPSPTRPRGVGADRGAARAVQPTRELLKAREGSKRSREEKVLEWQRNTLPVPIPPEAIKREGGGPAPRDPRDPRDPRRRRVSPAAITAALTAARHDSDSDDTPPTLTLHERFGKMAQWSADRSARLENMRITRREARLHVRIEGGATGASGAPGGAPGAESPELGAYPEELLAAAPGGLPSWDDVTVRYEYYRARGYLRGLTLADYVKWEEWWYKYQEWLERERAFERWAEGGGGGGGGGGGRRGPRRSRRHRRS